MTAPTNSKDHSSRLSGSLMIDTLLRILKRHLVIQGIPMILGMRLLVSPHLPSGSVGKLDHSIMPYYRQKYHPTSEEDGFINHIFSL
jgi:hypothetical protein